jgi:hypothetical protein
MNDENPNEPKKKRDWDRVAGRVMKTLTVIVTVAVVAVILVVGLALGACFFGKR